MTGWHCGSCGHGAQWVASLFVRCGKCERLVCGAKITMTEDGRQKFHCAPDCSNSGVLEGQIADYGTEPIEPTRASKDDLKRSDTRAPKLR